MDTISMRDTAVHDFSLINVIGLPFVGTASFLIRYTDGHTK